MLEDTNPGYTPFGYAGGLYDYRTNLVRFGARDYFPEIGRWTAEDPIGFWSGDVNFYAYVANDPVNYVDPSGLSKERGITVLGHFPEYIKLATKLNAKVFNIPTRIWERMTNLQRWSANQKFLDRMILRGDKVRLATPPDKIKPGSYYEKELNYLGGKGYKISSSGNWLEK